VSSRPGHTSSDVTKTAGSFLSLVLIVAACTSATVVPPEGREPDGANQLVTYTRDRTGENPSSLGAQVVDGPGSAGWSVLGANGCQAVEYPWSLSVGPRAAREEVPLVLDSDDGYQTVLDSGDVDTGTTIVWIDVSLEGDVTAGWGKPEWAEEDAPANCGS
jgi:hypothetical protein